MLMAVRSRNHNERRILYKILLIFLKYIPAVIALSYMMNTAMAYINVDVPQLSIFSGMSVLTWIFIYLASVVFRFCLYHKMFLYYIILTDIINLIDYYIGIPLSDFNILAIHSVITCIFILVILYFYIRRTDNVESSKRVIDEDNQ